MPRPLIALAALLLTLPTSASDWPQLARDPGRSGTTPDEIRPPFARKWYRTFPDEGIQAGVEPVVARGRLFVGTLRGTLHAIDVDTGKDLWTYQAGGPILHAAHAGHRRVVFTCADGKVYCLDAADGSPQWTVQTGAALWNAPAHDGENLLVGGRDGKLYAIHPTTGAVRWTAPVDGPILNSPAIDEKKARVYVGAEDMHAYAFDLATGKQLWRSPKLPGASFRGYHPVVAPDGSVMLTVTPVAGGDAIQQVLLDMTKEVFGEFASWRIKGAEDKKRIRAENFELMKKPETYRKQLDYLRKRLTDDPSLQAFFVLDPETGKQKFVAPIVYAESMNGPANPPLVTAAGKVIVKYNFLSRSRYEHYSPFLNVGYLDTATGDVSPLMDETRTYGWHDSLLIVHDEQSQLMAAGNVLINTHQDNVNALDLTNLQGYKAPFAHGVHEVAPGVAASLWAHHLHGKPAPNGWEWLARGTAVYGGGSAIDVPVVVAGDSFYFLPTHELNAGVALVAYKMDKGGQSERKVEAQEILKEKLTPDDWPKVIELKWDWDTIDTARLKETLTGLPELPIGTRANPAAPDPAALAAITDAKLDSLILDPPPQVTRPPTRNAEQVEARLAFAVDELIRSNWRPLLFPAAKAPSEAYRLFTDPADTLYTVALAYPHLSREVQGRIRRFVDRLSENGGPLARPLGARTYDIRKERALRSSYDEPTSSLLRISTGPARSDTSRLYPFYLWAANADQWQRIEDDWPALKRLASPVPEKDEPDLGNGRVSGLVAACRMAKKMRDEKALTVLLPQTRQALRTRLQYELAHPNGGLITAAGSRSLVGRWHNLTPELAAVLATFTNPVQQHLMDVYVDHHRPAWYVAWNVELLWRNESPFSFPDMSADIFAAKALLLNEPADRLTRYVDLPWCKADEYYVQKLALLARASR